MSSRARTPKAVGPSSRRRFLQASLASLALSTLANKTLAAVSQLAVSHPAVAVARSGLACMQSRVVHRDVVGVADFAQPSRSPRLHLVDMTNGGVETLLVAHGRGSDPEHTGWLQSFSNQPNSNATSQGHYLIGPYYDGAHGRSMRLHGLDASNSNAAQRGIVVHSAWYVGMDEIRQKGMLGRSEGCFAVSQTDLSKVLDRLGPGRLLIATKF